MGLMFPDLQGCIEYAPNQWETTLQCNVVFHWLGAYTRWSQSLALGQPYKQPMHIYIGYLYGYREYTFDKLLEVLEILSLNASIQFNGNILMQILGIHMSDNASSFIADLQMMLILLHD